MTQHYNIDGFEQLRLIRRNQNTHIRRTLEWAGAWVGSFTLGVLAENAASDVVLVASSLGIGLSFLALDSAITQGDKLEAKQVEIALAEIFKAPE